MLMMSRAAIAVAFALALAACSSSGGGAYGSGDPNLAAPNLGSGPISPFLADGQAVLKALDAISSHSGKPMRVVSLDSDRARGLTVHVQEPSNHLNVDEYIVAPDGTLTGPTPVKLMSMNGNAITAADIDRQAFDPAKIGLDHLTQTAREAIAKSTYSDARVSEWEFSGIGEDGRRFMYLDAARGRPSAELTSDFRIVQVRF